VRYVGTIQDVTEQQQAEQAVRDSEGRLRLAIEAGRMATWEYDVPTQEVLGSPALYRLLGFGPDETPTLDDIRARSAPGEAERLRQAAQAALARGEDYFELEHAYVWPDGSMHWLLARAEFLMKDGIPARVVGVVMDTTDRRRVEARLRDNEVSLRELLATIDLASVFVRAWDGAIRFWSHGCERLYGWSAAEAVGRSVHELLRTAYPVPRSDIEAHLEAGGEWEGDVQQVRRDGTFVTVSLRKVLRRPSDGGGPVVLEVARDVTALRQAEAGLRVLNQQLERRVQEEVVARDAAQARAAQAERMQALGQLAGGIAHDFNNVLQAVTSGIATIERRAADPAQVRLVAKMVLDAAARGAAVTRRMLVFARKGDLRTEEVESAALLEGMRDILVHTLGASITVEVAAAPDASTLLADRGQLETVLVNLATNARDAMPEGGAIIMRASAETVAAGRAGVVLRPGRYVALTVADTGTGMTPAVLARATEPFFSTKASGAGTGLGLAMARGFAEQSGGALRIDSAPGEGTVVTIWLPAPAAAASARLVSGQGAGAGLVPADVLLVDDDDDVRESLAAGLTDLGHRVRAASSGEAALALVRGNGTSVDCLVTDLSMPGMNGIALVSAIRCLRPGLPAIVLTGYAAHEALSGAQDLAAQPYSLLWKPTEVNRIAERISEVVAAN
jgi:PAS domain S-box-containing protein